MSLNRTDFFETLWQGFAELPEVEAIALGGSRAGDTYDEKSDYDLYIYCKQVPEESVRRGILEETCQYMEIGNSFWELEDDCTLKNGIDIDILYRNMDDFKAGLVSVVEEGHAYNGYTTCMWHNLLNSRILYDEKGNYQKLQQQFDIPYPKKLKENIIEKNMKLLHGFLPSYDGQIKKAMMRKDLVSVNHRVAAYLESYFDIVFAMNEMTHPGEKRMVEKALADARILPENFQGNIQRLFEVMYRDERALGELLQNMYEELHTAGDRL